MSGLAAAALLSLVSGAQAATSYAVNTYPFHAAELDAEYVVANGVVVNPFSGAAATANGYSPSDFGGTSFRQGKWVAGSTDQADGWSGSHQFTLSQIGYRGGGFQFGFDSNEPGHDIKVGFSRIQIEIDGVMVWNFDPFAGSAVVQTAIWLNDLANDGCECGETNNARGSGVDMGLYLPISTVAAAAGDHVITGASVLKFRWLQTSTEAANSSGAGAEQWTLLRTGVGQTFAADEVVNPPVSSVPAPAAAPLLAAALSGLAGLAGLGGAARRRRRR
ncbi:MAG: hypothetical protein VX463_12820 [Pseudomonadota bacterium]|nr:hypothetical protein [Pseudomonadota bacterium]